MNAFVQAQADAEANDAEEAEASPGSVHEEQDVGGFVNSSALDEELLGERAKNQAMADEIEKQRAQLENQKKQQEMMESIIKEMESKIKGGE